MARRGTKSSWKWNYFETLPNNWVKCIICGKSFWLRTNYTAARNHFRTQCNKYPSSFPEHSSEDWESQFITQNDEIKCKHCGKNYTISMTISTQMTNHLKETHETDENKTIKIIKYLYDTSYNENLKTGKYKCKKCRYTIFGDYNSSAYLLKHLIENIENHLTAIPANIRPKGLRELSSFSNYDREDGTATSINYQLPNQCRLRELIGPSNYGGKASIATSSNYQQSNVYSSDFNRLRELSGFSNFDREDGTATSINYQLPNQLGELNSPDGEAGASTTSNYQQANRLGELSNLSNYDGGANITTTDNHQQPNVDSLDFDWLNDFPVLPDASDDILQEFDDILNNIFDAYHKMS